MIKRRLDRHTLKVCIVGEHDCSDCVHAHNGLKFNGDLCCMKITGLFSLNQPRVVYDSNNDVWRRWNTCIAYEKDEDYGDRREDSTDT